MVIFLLVSQLKISFILLLNSLYFIYFMYLLYFL